MSTRPGPFSPRSASHCGRLLSEKSKHRARFSIFPQFSDICLAILRVTGDKNKNDSNMFLVLCIPNCIQIENRIICNVRTFNTKH